MLNKKLTSTLLLITFLLGSTACTKTSEVNSTPAVVSSPASNEGSEKSIYFMSQQHKINLPETWSVEETAQNEYRFKEGDKIVGGMYLVGYYDQNDMNAIPNHSDIVQSEKIENVLGKGTLYVIKRSEPAASQASKEWYEIFAVIPTQFDKGLAYTIWFQASDEKEREVMPSVIQIDNFKQIVGSLKMTSEKRPLQSYHYVDKTYGFALTLPANWENKYVIETRDKGIVVHYLHKEMTEIQADLFSITAWDKNEWEKEKDKPGSGRKIGEGKDYVFVLNLPFDNPFEGEQQKEYGNMVQEVQQIMGTFTVDND